VVIGALGVALAVLAVGVVRAAPGIPGALTVPAVVPPSEPATAAPTPVTPVPTPVAAPAAPALAAPAAAAPAAEPPVAVSAPARDQGIERALAHGHVEAILACIRRLDIPGLLDPAPSRERDLCVAIISQLLISGSRDVALAPAMLRSTI